MGIKCVRKSVIDYLEIIFNTFIIVLTILCLMFSLFGFKKPEPHDYIKWSADRKLKVSDFKMVDYPLKDEAVATTCTGILMDWERCSEVYKAFAIFDKEKSKWNAGLINKDRIAWVLNHEQMHFDLTQFVVNQLNVKLSGTTSISHMIREFDKHVIMLDSLQVMYDRQTNHGRDSTYQFLWNKLVNNLPK